MATKIKEMGYLGDCGYNQLLYPVETQTRGLLNWLVQKLPRTEDSAAEDVVGGNALLNKRIMESITAWKAAPWRLHFCAKGNKNFYFHRQAVTSSSPDVLGMYASLASTNGSLTTSIFERHARLLSRDTEYAKRLESDFSEEGSGSSANITHLVNTAFALAKQQTPSLTGTRSSLGMTTSDNRESSLATKSLQEIIADMSNDTEETGPRFSSGDFHLKSTQDRNWMSEAQDSLTRLVQSSQSFIPHKKCRIFSREHCLPFGFWFRIRFPTQGGRSNSHLSLLSSLRCSHQV